MIFSANLPTSKETTTILTINNVGAQENTPVPKFKVKRKTLVVLVGATGVGKTDISIALAKKLGAPIISTDSRQVFRGMTIGTAQPTAEQLSAVPHYFIADREPTAEYNAGIFEKEALALLDKLFLTHDYVVAVGGSGLYINALCYGFDNLPIADIALRERLSTMNLAELQEELQRLDAQYFAEVDKNNKVRLMRALEVCLISGRPYSELRHIKHTKRAFDIVTIGLVMPRGELYERINRRVDIMIAEGLEAEARALYPFKHLNALQTVGYREMFDYFDGKTSFEDAVELIKRNSRRYAKRQLTWFRKNADIEWVAKKDAERGDFFSEKFAEKDF